MLERIFDHPPWRRRALVALVVGAAWLPLGLLFRFEKFIALPETPDGEGGGALTLLRFLLPDVTWLLLTVGLWTLLAAIRSELGGRLWWGGFAVFQLLFYGFTVVEHSYFMHTGMQLHVNLFAYALAHLDMLGRIIVFGVDHSFRQRLLVAVACLATGCLVAWRFRDDGRWVPKVLPLGILGLAAVLAAIPATPRSVRFGLAGASVPAFLRPVPTVEALLRSTPGDLAAAGPYYRAPELTGDPERRPNVVLVILESTAATAVAPYAPEDAWQTTPFLAELAPKSLVVESAYGTVTHTSKALVGLLCGVMPRNTMEIEEAAKKPWELNCLPKLLDEMGYQTTFMQSALGGFEDRIHLVRRMGFASAAVQETLTRDRDDFRPVGYFGMDEMVMLDPAVEWVDSTRSTPFFLTLLTSGTHHPYEVPGVLKAASPEEAPLHYLAALNYQDRFLQQLHRRLEASGHLHNTLFIIVGDHGEAFGEHLRMQHDFVPYEDVVRVPWFLEAPTGGEVGEVLGPPRRVEGLRSQLDLLPTMLDVLGVPWQGTVPGRSLLKTDGHPRVFTSCWARGTCLSLREGSRKAVYHFRMRPLEVFDLAADPREKHDLSGELTEAEQQGLEQQILGEWLRVETFWKEHNARIEAMENAGGGDSKGSPR
ncbi:MAG: sulfatase-like hydrolase/transferase [Acidobacteriota bacterium]